MLECCNKNNLNKKKYHSCFTFSPNFSLLIISLLWNYLLGLAGNLIPVKYILLYSTFYSENFIINVFIFTFFYLFKGE